MMPCLVPDSVLVLEMRRLSEWGRHQHRLLLLLLLLLLPLLHLLWVKVMQVA
jgi:hypothetical protein